MHKAGHNPYPPSDVTRSKATSTSDVLIIGGGITGLAAAHYLQRHAPTLNVTIVEGASQWGGKIGTEHTKDFIIESGPDCFLTRKPRGIALCESLGIANQLVGRDPKHAKTFVLRHHKLHRLPAGLSGMIPTDLKALTESTLLSEAAIRHVTDEPNLAPKPASGDESIADFITRRLGVEAFENLVEPLMGGIYAGQAAQLSLAATFPHLRQLEMKHGSLLNGLRNPPLPPPTSDYPPFASFPNGMQTLVDAVVSQLNRTTMHLNTRVSRITKDADGYQAQVIVPSAKQPSPLHAKSVIVTTPAFVSSQLLKELAPTIAETLSTIPYASSALVSLAFDESTLPELDGYGYVIPKVEEREALACTWTSRKWCQRAPKGKVLLRVYIGRYGQEDVTRYSNVRLLDIAQRELQETLGIKEKPTLHRIIRYAKGIPQYNMGHLDRITALETSLSQHPGLHMAGAMFHGVGIPDCIASGESAATAVLRMRNESPSH